MIQILCQFNLWVPPTSSLSVLCCEAQGCRWSGRPLPQAGPPLAASTGPAPALAQSSFPQAPGHSSGPWERPVRWWGFPAWPVPGTGNVWARSQLGHSFSCWGGTALGHILEGNGWAEESPRRFTLYVCTHVCVCVCTCMCVVLGIEARVFMLSYIPMPFLIFYFTTGSH